VPSVAGLKQRLASARVELAYAFRAGVLGRKLERPPIVIAGCGHSGTTLLLSILDVHPAIFAIPYEAKLGKSELSEFRGKVALFDKQTIAAGKARWVEKTPANVFFLDRLFANADGLKVIIMVRDGRDVACSMRVRFEDSMGGRTAAFAHGVGRWVEENRQWLKHQNHPRLLMIKYEELTADFAATARRITDFLGEAFEPALLDFHRSKKHYLHNARVDAPPPPTQQHINQLRNWQVHQPLFDGSGRWRTEMSDDEKRLFKERAGSLLISFGYVEDNEW
jgi:sulfotransferase family protein